LLLAKPEQLAGLKAAATFQKSNSKNPATLKGGATKIEFKGAGRRPAVQNQFQNRRQDVGGAKLNVVETLAFQGRLQRAIHQDLG
jgi:hypothetical protein